MKKILFTLSMFAVAILLFENTINAQTNNSTPGLLKHIVIITFKQDASADSIKALDDIYNFIKKPVG